MKKFILAASLLALYGSVSSAHEIRSGHQAIATFNTFDHDATLEWNEIEDAVVKRYHAWRSVHHSKMTQAAFTTLAKRRFARADVNKNGMLTEAELDSPAGRQLLSMLH